MGYVGVPPQSGFITTAKQRVTSSTNNYVDLDHSISSLADVIVWVNFVKQDSTNLTLTTSSRITLGATLVASDIVEIAYLGKAVATQTPSSGTVTNDMLVNSSITLNGSAVSLGGSATTPSGDLVKLGTVSTSNSNVSALTIDNCFSSTYDLYRIVGFHNATTNGAHNYFRWRTGGASGSSYTTGNYQWINHGKFISSSQPSGDYFNGNYTADHGRVASDMDSDSNSSFVSFNLLVADPLTTLMSRGQVTGTSVVRQSTDDRWVTHHVGITNGADVSATGFQMTVSTGNISYGRVSVYGMKQA